MTPLDALRRLGAPVCEGCNTITKSPLGDVYDQAFGWRHRRCAACRTSVMAGNERLASAQQRAHEEKLRAIRDEIRQQEHRWMIDDSNRANSYSYLKAVAEHQEDIDAAMGEWGMGHGMAGARRGW